MFRPFKRAVLRALKDLEYERSVGKISPEDYAELSAKYRAEAKRLMQTLDDALEPARQKVEQQLQQRLERAGVVLPPEPALDPDPEKTPENAEKSADPEDET